MTPESPGVIVGQPAPRFTLSAIQGKTSAAGQGGTFVFGPPTVPLSDAR